MSETTDLQPVIEGYVKKLLETNRVGNMKGFCLDNKEIENIINAAQMIFNYQPILLEIEAPVIVCGDIHGQYQDLVRIFERNGYPPLTNYLFLGDYIDRGKQSLETICLLFCYKILHPIGLNLLRGNHESASINNQYGFSHECNKRLGNGKIWKKFNTCFQYMPVACIIEDRIFCMHGGLSPELNYVQEINQIKRPLDIPTQGLMADLMWSDPSDTHQSFSFNTERGIAYWYGKAALEEFLARNNLDLICRAHQCVDDGFEFKFDSQLVTLFSAPNYCGEFDNSGSTMIVNENLECSFFTFMTLERKTKIDENDFRNSQRDTIYLEIENQIQDELQKLIENETIKNEENLEEDASNCDNNNKKTPKKRTTGIGLNLA